MKKFSLFAMISAMFVLFGCAISPTPEKAQVTTGGDSSFKTMAVDPIYGIYSETQPVKIIWDTDAKLDIWTDSGAGMILTEVTSTFGEGTKCWRLKGIGTWMGMAVRVEPLTNLKDMSGYANVGSLNFMYKGKKTIKIGIKSGGTAPVEKWLLMTNGKYGFSKTNDWCSVSIPISFFSGVDLSKLQQYFMIAMDSTMGYASNTSIYIDNVYYSTNCVYAQPTNVVNSNMVTLYSEKYPINVNWDVDTIMETWNDTGIIEVTNTHGEGKKSWQIVGTGDWMGLGIRVEPTNSYRNLSKYLNGSLRFRFKGTRPLKIGVKSGTANEKWLTPAQLFRLGMTTNDTWCQVKIPIKFFKTLDLTNISYYFMIASDAATLYSAGTPYYIDDLYWTTNATSGAPTNVSAAKTFGLYSDTVPLDIVWDTTAKLDVWSDWSAGMTISEDLIDAPEGGKSWIFTGTGAWMGAGLRVNPLTSLKDMRAYTNGVISFMYKGTKRFKVGIKSGGTTPAEKWVTMANGTYGFVTNNTWCTVSIPVSAFSGVNLNSIEQYFMFVADSGTGYSVGSVYRIDNLFWGRP